MIGDSIVVCCAVMSNMSNHCYARQRLCGLSSPPHANEHVLQTGILEQFADMKDDMNDIKNSLLGELHKGRGLWCGVWTCDLWA